MEIDKQQKQLAALSFTGISSDVKISDLASLTVDIEKEIPKGKKKNSVAILNRISSALRGLPVPIIGRISDGTIILDLRCLENEPLFIKQLKYLNLKELTNE